MSTGQTVERQHDLNRLLTFVDAVIAIAITLLILAQVELTTNVGENDSVANLLRSLKPELWSFFLSFAVIARLWFAQHRTLRHVMRSIDVLDRLLVLWTLTIVFLPFPTQHWLPRQASNPQQRSSTSAPSRPAWRLSRCSSRSS